MAIHLKFRGASLVLRISSEVCGSNNSKVGSIYAQRQGSYNKSTFFCTSQPGNIDLTEDSIMADEFTPLLERL